MNTGR